MAKILMLAVGLMALATLALGVLGVMDGDPTGLLAALPGVVGFAIGFVCRSRSRR